MINSKVEKGKKMKFEHSQKAQCSILWATLSSSAAPSIGGRGRVVIVVVPFVLGRLFPLGLWNENGRKRDW